MKLLKTILVSAAVLSVISTPAFAQQGTSSGKITGYLVNIPAFNPSATAVFVAPAGGITGKPACAFTNRFVFDSTTQFGKQALATIMIALANDTPLRLAGTGDCPASTLSGNSEELRKICTESGPC